MKKLMWEKLHFTTLNDNSNYNLHYKLLECMISTLNYNLCYTLHFAINFSVILDNIMWKNSIAYPHILPP